MINYNHSDIIFNIGNQQQPFADDAAYNQLQQIQSTADYNSWSIIQYETVVRELVDPL